MNIVYPSNFTCPISKDLMLYPVKLIDRNFEYNFEKRCIELWRLTPNGDNNPLTNLSGFRDIIFIDNNDLKQQIDQFRIDNHITDN